VLFFILNASGRPPSRGPGRGRGRVERPRRLPLASAVQGSSEPGPEPEPPGRRVGRAIVTVRVFKFGVSLRAPHCQCGLRARRDASDPGPAAAAEPRHRVPAPAQGPAPPEARRRLKAQARRAEGKVRPGGGPPACDRTQACLSNFDGCRRTLRLRIRIRIWFVRLFLPGHPLFPEIHTVTLTVCRLMSV
jgi:hypothetical protein